MIAGTMEKLVKTRLETFKEYENTAYIQEDTKIFFFVVAGEYFWHCDSHQVE